MKPKKKKEKQTQTKILNENEFINEKGTIKKQTGLTKNAKIILE